MSSSPTAISRISPAERAWKKRARRLSVLPLLLASLLVAAEASARSRVTLLSFEGDSATALRWRVAQVLKRAGHTVLGFAQPSDPDSPKVLRSYAARRRVDAFVAGSAVEGEQGWTLTLSLRGADGARLGKPLTIEAGSLRELIQELKGDGQDRLDRALSARSGDDAAAGGAEAALDVDEPARGKAGKKSKKKRRARREDTEPAPGLRDVDLDAGESAPAPSGEEAEDIDAWGRDAGTRFAKLAKRAKGAEPAEQSGELDAQVAAAISDSPADEPSLSEPEEASSASESSTSDPLDDSSTASSSSESSEEPSPESEEGSSGSSESFAEDAGEDETASSVKGRWPTLIVGANAGVVYRSLVYSDDLYDRLREPTTNSVAYQLQATLYPFARPAKDRLALVFSFESAFSGEVKDGNLGKDFPVQFSELAGGMRFRQPLGGAHELAAQATIGRLSAGLDDPDKESRIPRIDYTLVRPAVELGLGFGAVSVRGAVAYRLPIGGFGEVSGADYFPRMEGYGIDGVLGLGYQFSDDVSLHASGSMRRFVLTMNSTPQDAMEGRAEVAGGAVDLYLSGYFGLAITL